MRAGFAGSSAALAFALLALLALAFVAFARTTTLMALGEPSRTAADAAASARGISAGLPLVAGLAILLVLGVWIPGGLDRLITGSIAAIR